MMSEMSALYEGAETLDERIAKVRKELDDLMKQKKSESHD